ncbi:MAG: response regulator [Anaerolineae bacterium]|jgi:CheY-like chemotaxis protein|nr:response regulator [Anaerolineae bacterium]
MENWQILVIEDDKDGQELVSRMLKHHRIPHTVTGTGEEAIQALKRGGVTACIVDLALPGIDGWGVLKAVQTDPALSHIPCVAVTAFHSAEVAVKAIEAGFFAYFPKPLEATSFVRELTSILSAK